MEAQLRLRQVTTQFIMLDDHSHNGAPVNLKTVCPQTVCEKLFLVLRETYRIFYYLYIPLD